MIQRSDLDLVAQATLYEGYVLFPYRSTARKNRFRWTFGAVFPPAYVGAGGTGETSSLRTECLLHAGATASIAVELRFLRPVERRLYRFDPPLAVLPEDVHATGTIVDQLRVGDQLHSSWQEAVEERVTAAEAELAELLHAPHETNLRREQASHDEALREGEQVAGCVRRELGALHAVVSVTASAAGDGITRISVEARNVTEIDHGDAASRERAVLHALASCHVVLQVQGGRWLSLADPPPAARAAAQACRNEGLWPTLIGDEDDIVLASPIILDDHPQVAPESPGDLYDSSEIDELLTLTIRALGDDEQREIIATDERARIILERTQQLDREKLLQLHGVLREPR